MYRRRTGRELLEYSSTVCSNSIRLFECSNLSCRPENDAPSHFLKSSPDASIVVRKLLHNKIILERIVQDSSTTLNSTLNSTLNQLFQSFLREVTMTVGTIIRQASSKAFSFRKGRRSMLQEQGSSNCSRCFPAPCDDDSSKTHAESDSETTADCHHICFGAKLAFVRDNKGVTKVNLCNFIGRYEQDELLALTKILRTSTRQWKCIEFEDQVEGTNYRRWLFRRDHVRSALRNALAEQERRLSHKVPIYFEERLKIDIDELPLEAIGSVLKEVEKDRCVRELTMEGLLAYQDVESVIGPLVSLLSRGDRNWKRVVIRVSFDGDVFSDFPKWEAEVHFAKFRLDEMSAYRNIPIDFQIC
jgi:hypothetical protein